MRFKFCLHFSMNTTVKACFLKGVLHSKNIGKMTFTEKLCFEVNVMKAKRLIYLQNHIQLFMILYLSISLFLSPIGYALDRLVTVSCMHYCTSTSVLSTSSSSRGLTTCVGISHLEGGFTLRCLQRLSRPGLATLPCSW